MSAAIRTRAAAPPPKSRKAAAVIAAVVTLVSWGAIYFVLTPSPPKPHLATHVAVGEVLAQEALKQLGSGGRLIVIARDTQRFKAPASDAQMLGFQRALKKGGGKITMLRPVKEDPLRPVRVQPGEFFDLLRKAEEKDVIVSFMGPPQLNNEQLAKIGKKRPRILAVCSGAMPLQVDLKKLFEQELLHVAVISRDQRPGATAQGRFEDEFKLITADNVSEMPVPLARF